MSANKFKKSIFIHLLLFLYHVMSTKIIMIDIEKLLGRNIPVIHK